MSGFITRPLSADVLRLLTMTRLGGTVTNPDLGFQLSICVNRPAELLMMQALRTAITAPRNIGGMMVTVVPPSTPLDTRVNCLDGERLGLWFPTAPAAGRDEALRLPSRLLPGENYLQTISLNGLRFVANAVWNSPATPKRIRLPDPFADARLSSFDVSLAAPNLVITRISGIVPIAVLPDVRFQVTFTDRVFLDGAGRVMCTPNNPPQVNVDHALLRVLLGNALNAFATVFLGAQVGGMAGLGCRVLGVLAPGFIDTPIPACRRIDFPYSRLDVDGAGVTLGSRAALAPCLLASRVVEEPFRAPR